MPPLTDMALRKAKPTERTQKLFDGGGLYLEISPSNGRWWRLKYRFDGKEKRLAIGVYPDVPLSLARQRREDARQLLARGVDPGEHKKAAAAARAELGANTFEVIAREWLTKRDWVDSYPSFCKCPPTKDEVEAMKGELYLLDQALQREQMRSRVMAGELAGLAQAVLKAKTARLDAGGYDNLPKDLFDLAEKAGHAALAARPQGVK